MSGLPTGISFIQFKRYNDYANHYRPDKVERIYKPALQVRNNILTAIINLLTFKFSLVSKEYIYIGIFIVLVAVFFNVINNI
jgi:hypothetical protein